MGKQLLRERGASRSANRRARPHLLFFFSYATVVISREVRRRKCGRLLISQQQRGWDRGINLFSNASKDGAARSTSPMRRERNQLHLRLVFGIGDNSFLSQGCFQAPRLYLDAA